MDERFIATNVHAAKRKPVECIYLYKNEHKEEKSVMYEKDFEQHRELCRTDICSIYLFVGRIRANLASSTNIRPKKWA